MADDRQKQVDDFYRARYGFDPSRLTPEMRAQADAALGEANQAIGHRVMWSPRGWVENPAYKRIREQGGLDAEMARKLSIYQAWKNGELPEQGRPLSEEEKRQHGVTPEMMKAYDADKQKREDEWVSKTAGRYATLVATDTKNKAENEQRAVEMEPEQVSAKATPRAAGAEGAASQPSSAPAADDPQRSQRVAFRGAEARKRAGVKS